MDEDEGVCSGGHRNGEGQRAAGVGWGLVFQTVSHGRECAWGPDSNWAALQQGIIGAERKRDTH